MKKIMHKVMAVISVIAVSIFAGCMSAKHLLEKGDTVSAIEKLAKNLTKKSTSQDDADMFVSVYPYAVEERLENPETVSEVVQGFIESKNAFSLGVALETVKKSLPGGTFIGEESSVRQAVNQADKAYTRAEDLYRIQKAVRAMPVEIGDPRKGNVYLVEKYSDDFSARYNEASREMSRFVYAIAEAGYPGSGVNEKKKLYDLYEKAAKYDSNIIGDCNLRQASLAYSIGDALVSSSSLQDKKDALDYFKKCDTKKPGYNDVKKRILGCNYDIGTYYLDRFESGKSRSDIKEAIYYFGYAKDYKDAVSMKAYCESLLSELDNPPSQVSQPESSEPTEVRAPEVLVDFGNLVYSESAPMAALTIKVSNADHLLSAGEFKVSKSNTIGSVEIAANKRAANSSAPMIYVATVSKITGDGSFTISVLNQKGGVIETSETYTISKAKLFAPPILSSGKIVYSKTDSDISVDIVVRNLKKTVTPADIVISQNTTGGKLTEVSVGTSSTGYPTYNAVFEGVTQSGTILLSVLGDDGSFIATSDGKTSISYTVNFANVYVPPVTVPEKTDSTSSSTEKPSTASSASSSGTTNSSAGKTSTTDNLMKQPLKPAVTFGPLVYSKTEPSVTQTVSIKGLTYVLAEKSFDVSVTGKAGKPIIQIPAVKTKLTETNETVYGITIPNIEGATGFSVVILDPNGKDAVAKHSEKIDSSKVYVPAVPVEVTFGSVTFSKTDYEATFPVNIKGLDYLLTDSNFVKENQGGLGYTGVTVKTSATKAPKTSETVTYTVTVPGGDRKFKMSTKDKSGRVINERYFEFTDSQFPARPWVQYSGVAYSSTSDEVYLGISDNGVFRKGKKSITAADIVINNNGTGGTVARVEPYEDYYNVVLTGVKQSGSVSLMVKWSNGNYASTTDNYCDPSLKVKPKRSNTNTLIYSVDSTKVYVAPVAVTPTVTFGSVTFSKTDYEATFPVNIKGLDYLLTDSNFVKENQGGLGYTGVTVKTSATKAPKTSETVTYTVTVPGGDRKFKMSTKDKSGRVINERYFEFTDSQFPARPWVQYSGVAYSSTSDEVYLGVSDNGVFRKGKKSIVLSDITVTVNGTGGIVTKVEPYEDYYRITLKGVKQSGTVQLKVKWSNGNYAATSDSWCDTSLKVKPKRAETTLVSYQVDSSKVYVPVAPRSSYKEVTYSATANEIYLQFGVAGVKKAISFADISIASNNTNGQASKIESVVQKAKSDVALYNLILKNVEQSGVVEIRVKGDDGNFLLADEWAESSVMNPTAKSAVKSTGRKDISIIHYEIDAKKVYAPRTVTFGSVTYSKTESVATFPFTVKGLAYILGTSNFNLKAISGSGIDGVTINANSTQTPKLSDSVTYTVTVPGGDRKFDLVIKDNNAKEISTRHFEFSASQFYQPPRFEYLKDVTYEDNSPIVTAHVYISGVNKVLNGKDMSSVEVNSGTASAEILYVARGTGAESNHYEIGLTNFFCSSSSGSVYLRVKGDDGKYLKVTKYATAKHPTDLTLLPVTIDSSKMKLKPTASFYSISQDDIKASSVTFKLAVWGVNYLLTDSNFVRELTGTVGNVSISTARKTAPKVTERVEYTVNVTGLSKRNDGTLTIKAKDKSGNIIGERFYYFDPSKLTDEQQDKGELLRLQKENALKGYLLQSDSLKSALDKNSSKTFLKDKNIGADVLKVDTSKAVIDSKLSDKLKK